MLTAEGVAVVRKMFERVTNAMAALAGAELKMQFDERPIRFHLEVERIASQDGKTIIEGIFAADFPEVSPRRNSGR
jgi:hypothetical protein